MSLKSILKVANYYSIKYGFDKVGQSDDPREDERVKAFITWKSVTPGWGSREMKGLYKVPRKLVNEINDNHGILSDRMKHNLWRCVTDAGDTFRGILDFKEAVFDAESNDFIPKTRETKIAPKSGAVIIDYSPMAVKIQRYFREAPHHESSGAVSTDKKGDLILNEDLLNESGAYSTIANADTILAGIPQEMSFPNPAIIQESDGKYYVGYLEYPLEEAIKKIIDSGY